MNAEELLSIATDLVADFSATGTANKIGALHDALAATINQPNQPQHQNQLAAARNALTEALRSSDTNEYPPTWINRLNELDAYDITGDRLLETVEQILGRHEITPAGALGGDRTVAGSG